MAKPRADLRRVAVAAALLAVTAIGVRARGAFTRAAVSGDGRTAALGLAVAEGVALVAFVLVLVYGRPERTKRPDDELVRLKLPWWVRPLGVMLALGALVTPLAVLVAGHSGRQPVQPQVSGPRPPDVSASGAARQAGPLADAALWALAAGAAVAVVLIAVLALWLRHRRRAALRGPAPAAGRLAAALAAASEALMSAADPRSAIIASYAALERGFAAAGSAPHDADTPAEVLARAGDAGLLRSGAAASLTGLFRRARYSTEPITRPDAAAAAAALERLRADLEATP